MDYDGGGGSKVWMFEDAVANLAYFSPTIIRRGQGLEPH